MGLGDDVRDVRPTRRVDADYSYVSYLVIALVVAIGIWFAFFRAAPVTTMDTSPAARPAVTTPVNPSTTPARP